MRSQNRIDALLSRVFHKEAVKYSLCVSIAGGTVVNLVNQADIIYYGEQLSIIKAIITYFLFYLLSVYIILRSE